MSPVMSIMRVPLRHVFNIPIPELFVSMCLHRTGTTHTIFTGR